jgi:hypothetical protein
MTNPIVNNKDNLPLAHYTSIYTTLVPEQIAQRCNIKYNSDTKQFAIKLVGTAYNISFPDFIISENNDLLKNDSIELKAMERILLLRFLCESKYSDGTGKQLSYAQVPWGNVYLRNFNGRCILRAAKTFGKRTEGFTKAMESCRTLNAVNIKQKNATCSAAYRFEFINNLYMSIILWEGDDEFPPQAQFLFDDNFVNAFSAEDIVVATEVAISRLSEFVKVFDT